MREFVNPLERKLKTEAFLKENEISFNKNLNVIESSKEVKIKNKAEICKRLKAGVIMLIHASKFGTKKFDESRKNTRKAIDNIEAGHLLDETEKELLKKGCTYEDAEMIYWNVESLGVICWALGIINDDDMKSTNQFEGMIETLIKATDMPLVEIIEKNEVRDVEDILDMLDLYFRYHWVLVEKRYNPGNDDIKTGDLNLDIVIERRKALEWLVSDLDDWSEIRMDT